MKKIKKYLKKKLTKERYRHTVGVAYTAVSMAMRYNPNQENSEFLEKAYIAGMLHDCAKCMEHEKKIQLCKENNIPCTSFELEHPYLLHAKVGAYIAQTKFDIKDEDILNAITWHTTGRPGMSLLEKIIFIADYIEPGRRPIPGINEVRQTAFTDIDEAMKLILKHTLDYLKNSGSSIDEMTQKTYDSYL